MRKIDLTKQDIRCFGEPMLNDYTGTLNFTWECWFDVDNYFGVDTSAEEDWVNFYTDYDREKDRITASYSIDTPDSIDTYEWELTKDEELFLRKLMEDYVGCDLKTYYDREFK